MKKILTIICTLTLVACSKQSSDQKHCWQLIDANGNPLNEICGKTEAELIHCSDCGVYANQTTWNLDSCDYICLDCNEPVYCWYINNRAQHHLKSTYKQIKCWMPTAIQIDCNYTCGMWETRYKKTYKPTNTTFYTAATSAEYCDSAYFRLNGPDSIVIKNTPDSLILLQRRKDTIGVSNSFY